MVLTLVAFCIVGCKPPEPPKPPKPAEVFVATPTEETVTDHEEFTGRTHAEQTVELRARVTGYLDSVHFKDGALVKEGELLFEIDDGPYVSEAERAAAAVEQGKAKLERLTRQENRVKQLLATKAISQENYDQVAFDRSEAVAALAAATATKGLADLNLGYTKVYAPISGRIGRRLIDAGNLVRADETPLANIVSLDPIQAYFDIDERTVLRIRRLITEGKVRSARDSKVVVEIGLADHTDFPLKGTIDFIDNQIEASTGTLRARAEIPNKNFLLSPGFFVRLRMPIGDPHPSLLVPEEALGSDQGHRFLYVLNDKNEVNYRRVQVGPLRDGRRVIESGITATDRVVVEGLQRVKRGEVVIPKSPAESPSLAALPAKKMDKAEKKVSEATKAAE